MNCGSHCNPSTPRPRVPSTRDLCGGVGFHLSRVVSEIWHLLGSEKFFCLCGLCSVALQIKIGLKARDDPKSPCLL